MVTIGVFLNLSSVHEHAVGEGAYVAARVQTGSIQIWVHNAFLNMTACNFNGQTADCCLLLRVNGAEWLPLSHCHFRVLHTGLKSLLRAAVEQRLFKNKSESCMADISPLMSECASLFLSRNPGRGRTRRQCRNFSLSSNLHVTSSFKGLTWLFFCFSLGT